MPKTNHRVRLTPTKIAGLKPAPLGRRYQVMDAEVPGFGIRVTDSGHRSFIFRTRFGGSATASRREIAACEDITLAEARERARAWRSMVQKGLDPRIEERRHRSAQLRKLQMTFGAVAQDFIERKLPTERKGKDAEREIRRDLMPVWKDIPIAELTDLDVASLVKDKARTGKVGARNLLALIKRFFRWASAQPEYGLRTSPCISIRASDILGEMPRPKGRVLTNDELFAFWRATRRMTQTAASVYQLLLLTGLRLNEAADAAWTEFNFRERIWVIPANRMKGRDSGKKQARAHVVPLTDEIMRLIESLPRFVGGIYLFSASAGRTPIWITTRIKQRLDARMHRTLKALARSRGECPAGVTLPHFVNHDLRRTVRSHLSRLKIAEEAREAVLAHARSGIKGTYDLYDYLDEKREALELWQARLRHIAQ